jgi:hypothetical protein
MQELNTWGEICQMGLREEKGINGCGYTFDPAEVALQGSHDEWARPQLRAYTPNPGKSPLAQKKAKCSFTFSARARISRAEGSRGAGCTWAVAAAVAVDEGRPHGSPRPRRGHLSILLRRAKGHRAGGGEGSAEVDAAREGASRGRVRAEAQAQPRRGREQRGRRHLSCGRRRQRGSGGGGRGEGVERG